MTAKRVLILATFTVLILTGGVILYIAENVFTVFETASVMSIKPVKTQLPRDRVKENIPVGGIRADLYLAENNEKPLVVIIHGGFWQGGNKENLRFLGRFLAHDGYSVLIPELPAAYGMILRNLLPESVLVKRRHPVQQQTVDAVLSAIARGGSDYRSNGRVVLFGIDSGVQLALQSALKGTPVSGLIGLNAVVDLRPEEDTFRRMYVAPVFGTDAAVLTANSPAASPRKFTFPLLFLDAEFAPPHLVGAASAYAEALKKIGNRVEHRVLKQRATRSLLFKIGRYEDETGTILFDFLKSLSARN